MALITHALTAADVNLTINHQPRIEDLRLGAALGFDRPRNIRALIRRHARVLAGFGEVCFTRSKPSPEGGRPGQTYYLNKRQALFITAKSDTERAAHVTVRMVEVFDEVTSGRPIALPPPPAKIPVRAYERAPRRSPVFDGSQEGRGCVVIDGALVYFDAHRIPGMGEQAIVVKEEGGLAVETVAIRDEAAPRGFVYVEEPTNRHWRSFAKVPLVGVVTTAAGQPRRVTHS